MRLRTRSRPSLPPRPRQNRHTTSRGDRLNAEYAWPRRDVGFAFRGHHRDNQCFPTEPRSSNDKFVLRAYLQPSTNPPEMMLRGVQGAIRFRDSVHSIRFSPWRPRFSIPTRRTLRDQQIHSNPTLSSPQCPEAPRYNTGWLVGNDLRTWHHSGRITGYPEVMPQHNFQRRGPEAFFREVGNYVGTERQLLASPVDS